MTHRPTFGPVSGPGFEPAAVAGPFSGPPAAARALALALGCPDLFLIDATPGPDRDGFAAAVAATAARCGRTVLLVAPDSNSADALLSHLSADRDPPAARAVAESEEAEDLPATVRERTTIAFRDRVESGYRSRVDGITNEWRAAESAAAEARAMLLARKAERARIPTDVDSPRVLARQTLSTAREQIAHLSPLRSAKEHNRIWSGLFWKATLDGNFTKRITELESEIRESETACQTLDEQAAVAVRLDAEIESWGKRFGELFAEAEAVNGRLAAAKAERPLPVHPIVVAPLSAVGSDPATTGPFDTLLLTFAERVSFETLESLQRLATRCVLIGSRFGRLAGPLFAELYAERDTNSWVAEAGRLVFRNTPVPPQRRNELKCEPLADRPEIELRFLSATGRGDVALAEVAFPDTMSAADARAWLAAELGIVRLSPCGRHHWHDGPGPHRACWHLADTVPEPTKAWADLGNGIRLLVAGTGAEAVTAAVTFEPDQWDRPAAEAWLAEALGDVPPRAVRLPKVPVQAPNPVTLSEPVAVG